MKRSIMGLMYLIQGMRSAGVDVDARLKEIGIQFDQLDPQALIHRELEWIIQQHISKELDSFLGLLIGQHYALAGYGPFLMFLMTSRNVEQALSEAMQYQCLTYVFGQLSYQQENNHVAIIYTPIVAHDIESLLRTQAEISGTYRFIRDIYKMMGLPNLDIQVELPIDIPEEPEKLLAYEAYYGSHVRFGFKHAKFWMDSNILKYQLGSFDLIMHEVYRQRCEDESTRMQDNIHPKHLLITKIEDYLLLQSENIPNLSMLSKALAIPERTLRHQLRSQNTSFQKIRENILKKKAQILLNDESNTIEKIASILGYAETASFNHAFKKWFGMSPKKFKNLNIS